MYKILGAASSGAVWLQDEKQTPLHFRTSRKEGGKGEIVPLGEVHPMELQAAGIGIDKRLIEGVIGEKSDLTAEDIENISRFVRTLNEVELLRNLAEDSSSKIDEERELQEAFTEAQASLRNVVRELNPAFDIDGFLKRFEDIRERVIATRQALGRQVDEEVSDREIAFNARMLNNERQGLWAFTVRMAAELALALKESLTPQERTQYYNEVVRRLGVLSEKNQDELDVR